MADRQLRLFEHPKPLLERLGAEFFRAIPKHPGVYIMCSALGQVLYVGQSSNLRTRLATYCRANPDHTSRRILRLIHAAARVCWEECETPSCARVRENELLRLHRPKFNRANVYPLAYCFIGFKASAEQLTLFRTTEANSNLRLFGAFKGAAIYAFGSLLRLLWSAIHRPRSPFDLPRLLLSAKPPRQFAISLSQTPSAWNQSDFSGLLEGYFDGESSEIIVALTDALNQGDRLSIFHRNLIESDLETLGSFFKIGPARNRRLKHEHALHDQLIPQEELDDWIALSRRSGRKTANDSDQVGISLDLD